MLKGLRLCQQSIDGESTTPIEAQPAKPKWGSSKDDVGDFMEARRVSLTYLASQALEPLLLSNEIPGREFFQEGHEKGGEACQTQD